MIDKIPPEIILKTSKYLHFKDKLNLAKTCRKLNDLISNGTLYEILDLFKYGKKLDNIINKFENNPFDGSQVKTLRIQMTQIPDQLRFRLSTVFPNVIQVITGKNNTYDQAILPTEEVSLKEPMSRWINTLQSFNVYSDLLEIYTLLRFHTFPHLTDLKLGLSYTQKVTTGLNPLLFSPLITNAPSLTMLTLYDCDISLELLEEIHNSCRYIKTLMIQYAIILVDNFSLPEEISPANSVLKLEIYDTLSIDRNGILLEYIQKKYRKMCHLVLDIDRYGYSLESKISYYFPNFFNDNDSENEINSEYDEMIQRYRSDFLSGVNTYNNVAGRFFSGLPKTIKVLKMDVKSFDGAIEKLGESNMNLTELDFIDSMLYRNILKSPSQLGYIQKLTSLKILKIPINASAQRYNDGIISTSVTTLVIECQNGPLNIDWLLRNFPSLESLFIKRSKCTIEGLLQDTQVHYHNLRSFRASKCLIYPMVLPFLRTATPNLTTMNLWTIHLLSESNRKVCEINLSNCNIEKFEMSLSATGLPKKIKYYNQASIKTNAEALFTVSLGGDISLTKENAELGKTEKATKMD